MLSFEQYLGEVRASSREITDGYISGTVSRDEALAYFRANADEPFMRFTTPEKRMELLDTIRRDGGGGGGS